MLTIPQINCCSYIYKTKIKLGVTTPHGFALFTNGVVRETNNFFCFIYLFGKLILEISTKNLIQTSHFKRIWCKLFWSYHYPDMLQYYSRVQQLKMDKFPCPSTSVNKWVSCLKSHLYLCIILNCYWIFKTCHVTFRPNKSSVLRTSLLDFVD